MEFPKNAYGNDAGGRNALNHFPMRCRKRDARVMSAWKRCHRSCNIAFTLLEILVSCAALALLLVFMVSITGMVQTTYRRTQGKAEQFREARVAFEAITRRLAQSTLNTYWDYHYPGDDLSQPPDTYIRQSELRFRCGQASDLLPAGTKSTTQAVFFQSPFGFTADVGNYGGLESMLNTWGYFIEFGDDSTMRPPVVSGAGIATRNRYRLYEMRVPGESITCSIYKWTSNHQTYNGADWFQVPLGQANRSAGFLAANIVALIFIARDPDNAVLTTDYGYDSSPDGRFPQSLSVHQLPPNIQVTMVAIDEASAARLDTGATPPDLGLAGLFTTVGDVTNEANPGYAQDLQTLGSRLAAKHINYRVFTTTVSVRGAKWNWN